MCVGEYITLYQLQRGMLRQRAQEKDEQVARLAQDKEALRSQLTRLNCLVQQLVGGARPLNTTTNLGNSLAVFYHSLSITYIYLFSLLKKMSLESLSSSYGCNKVC